MRLPSLFDFGFASILYVMLGYIIGIGIWGFIQRKRQGTSYSNRSLLPLGSAALVVGIIAHVQRYREAFDLIEMAGDISPSIVASAFSSGFDYLTLGLLCLFVSFIFKYLNQ